MRKAKQPHRHIPGRSTRRGDLSAMLVVFLLLVPLIVSAGENQNQQIEVLEERSGDGEQCIVCRQGVDDGNVVEVRYKGRTFHVRTDMLETFRADPETYFRALQPRSALFDEETMVGALGSGEDGMGWLYFGLYVLVGLLFAAVCGYLAVARARSPLPWFLLGLLFNVFGLVALFLSPRGDPTRWPEGVPSGLVKVPATLAPLACPSCGRTNHPSARACAACGAALQPEIEGEASRV